MTSTDKPTRVSSMPTRLFRLRRAPALQSTKEDLFGELGISDTDSSPAPTPRKSSSGGGFNFRASISKKFKEVKDASVSRSKSLGKLPGAARLHKRAFSDVSAVRPTVSHANTEPPNSARKASFTHTTHIVTNTIPEEVQCSSPISGSLDVNVPHILQEGTPMTKVSAKKQKRIILRVDADLGQLQWDSKVLPIECIKELRSSANARYYREQFQLSREYEPRWITIIYVLDGKYKSLHLVAATYDVFEMWDTTIRRLFAIRQQLMSGLGNAEMRQAVWEKLYWKSSDQEADQKLEFDEIEKLCKRLNVNTSTEDLYQLFKQADTARRGYLDFTSFKHFVRSLKTRPEISHLYRLLREQSCNGAVFDFSVFAKFMRDEQKSTFSMEELQTVFNKFASVIDPMLDGDRPQQKPSPNGTTWTLEAFTVFLMSPDNSASSEHHSGVWHDMSHPLYDYYISSSHNTYLVGHQLVGDSTIEGYIRALLHGCRSVEVDIYDGEVEPMIFHGKTLTSKVSLRDVCHAILNYGFVTTDYPIIISAEIHCGVSQQDLIVKIMSEVFGDALVRAPAHGRPRLEALPSPEDLKRCILLKAKNLFIRPDRDNAVVAMDVTSTDASSTSESEQGSSALDCDADGVPKGRLDASPPISVPRQVSRQGHRRSSSTSVIMSSGSGHLSPSLSPPKAVGLVRRLSSRRRSQGNPEPPKVKMSFALVALLVYTVGVKFRGINKKEEYAPEHMFSLSENTCHRMMRQGMLDLIKHNRSHLIRIYPRGTRLKSTNFEPHRFWSTGAQLVAINWQTFDLGYMLNHAMFQRNGRSGYVLKPLALRAAGKHLLSKMTRHRLEINVISAQQLPRPKDAMGREKMDKSMVDPFVEVSLHIPDWTQPLPQDPHTVSTSPGEPNSAVPGQGPLPARTISYRTGTVKSNGFNPVWQDKFPLTFECLGDMKELIFVRFAVKQENKEDEEPLALYCISLASLQQGYRHLPLHDSQLSQYLFSTLFVHIALHDIP